MLPRAPQHPVPSAPAIQALDEYSSDLDFSIDEGQEKTSEHFWCIFCSVVWGVLILGALIMTVVLMLRDDTTTDATDDAAGSRPINLATKHCQPVATKVSFGVTHTNGIDQKNHGTLHCCGQDGRCTEAVHGVVLLATPGPGAPQAYENLKKAAKNGDPLDTMRIAALTVSPNGRMGSEDEKRASWRDAVKAAAGWVQTELARPVGGDAPLLTGAKDVGVVAFGHSAAAGGVQHFAGTVGKSGDIAPNLPLRGVVTFAGGLDSSLGTETGR